MNLLSLQKNVHVLLISTFVRSLAYFVLIYLLALLFLEHPFNFSAAEIGTLIGIFALADKGIGIFWASCISIAKSKRYLIVGTIFTTFSMLMLCVSQNFYLTLVMMILLGAGGSLTSLAARIWVTTLKNENERAFTYSWMHRTVNAAAFLISISVFNISYAQLVIPIMGFIAFSYFVSGVVIYFFFNPKDEPQSTMIKEGVAHSFDTRALFNVLKSALPYFLIYFLATYCISQEHLLPFYFKQESTIPSFMGLALGLNPILIVLFQGVVSKIFLTLHKKDGSLGLLLGCIFFFIGFIALALFASPHKIWIFSIMITMGEMLIIPHMDYLFSLCIGDQAKSYVFATTGMMFAAGRSIASAGGIFALGYLSHNSLSLNLWWWGNALILGIVVVSMYSMQFYRKAAMEKRKIVKAKIGD